MKNTYLGEIRDGEEKREIYQKIIRRKFKDTLKIYQLEWESVWRERNSDREAGVKYRKRRVVKRGEDGNEARERERENLFGLYTTE